MGFILWFMWVSFVLVPLVLNANRNYLIPDEGQFSAKKVRVSSMFW